MPQQAPGHTVTSPSWPPPHMGCGPHLWEPQMSSFHGGGSGAPRPALLGLCWLPQRAPHPAGEPGSLGQ